MNAEKKFITKTFNNEFVLYLNFLIKLFPNKNEIKKLKTIINLLIKYNPPKLIYLFNHYVTLPYDNIIQSGDYEYFTNKYYSPDLSGLKENAEYVLKIYNEVRQNISSETAENKQICMKFIQNLSSLSKLYYS